MSKKAPKKLKASVPPQKRHEFHTREERLIAGKALRDTVPRSSHAAWNPPANRKDPIDILENSNRDRLQELIPIRYGRMVVSPFTFLRGSAALMAYDLATFTPNTGLNVQACGDAHLLNFGIFATPERNLVFDLNDFDETHPAPWEWDLKRLAVSFAVAGRDSGLSDEDSKKAVLACARSYREHLREYSKMSALEVWYTRIDMETLIKIAPDEKTQKIRQDIADKARRRIGENLFPKIATQVNGRHRFIDQPPVLFHVAEEDIEQRFQEGVEAYRESLSDERRVLFDRYRLEDFALKVVGIGSVGTRCFIGLFMDEENHPLILQVKEATHSVLEPYTDKSRYDNQGQRVVMGQRLMQSSSDIFLGWVRGARGYDFFVRQLRDMKMSVGTENISAERLKRYAEVCGWTLARAHAKSGDAASISGYLGKNDTFDEALGKFALAYADQNEKDYAALVEAVRSGRIDVLREED